MRQSREWRIALCHEWLTTYGGSDQAAAAIADAYGIEDIFTITFDPDLAARLFPRSEVRSVSKVGLYSFVRNHWQWMLFFMPYMWRHLDLSRYDLVITSSHACTNALKVQKGTLRVCYCYTPMRYAWNWREEVRRIPLPLRVVWPLIAAWLRRADRRWAQNVDHFIAISQHVAERIRRHYSRDAVVIHPPVDTTFWAPGDEEKGNFFLVAGRLVAYKRADIAVEAMTRLGLPLVVAGSGPELARLRRVAGPTVTFVERPSAESLRELYRSARALIFPGKEDFGLTPIEAQACGTPVVALDEGGARETVVDGMTGVLYPGLSPEGLIDGLKRFEQMRFDPDVLRKNAQRFDSKIFEANFTRCVDSLLDSRKGGQALPRSDPSSVDDRQT